MAPCGRKGREKERRWGGAGRSAGKGRVLGRLAGLACTQGGWRGPVRRASRQAGRQARMGGPHRCCGAGGGPQ